MFHDVLLTNIFTKFSLQVAKDFVEMLRSKKDVLEGSDFLEELKKYFLEVTGVFTLGARLGSIQPELPVDSLPAKLMAAAFDTNSNILATDNGWQLWRHLETKSYTTIRKSQEYIANVALNYIQESRQTEK